MPTDPAKPLFDVAPPAPFLPPEQRLTLAEQGEAEVAKILATKPSSFTVGAYSDGKAVTAAVTFDRHWSNGFGLTAYARAWWNDASVTPGRTSGAKVGADGRYQF